MTREELERRSEELRLLPPATREDHLALVRGLLMGLAGAVIVWAILFAFAAALYAIS